MRSAPNEAFRLRGSTPEVRRDDERVRTTAHHSAAELGSPKAASNKACRSSRGLTVAKPRITVRALERACRPSRKSQREESEVKRFMLLHFGFEKPTPEIMAAWGKWFESVADKTVDQGGFHGGAREISHSGIKDLPMEMESITGYSIINAESLDDAEKIAQDNPFVASIRVYEIMAK